MRRSALLVGILLLLPATARARDWPLLERWAQRTPAPIRPVEHSAARAGNPLSVSSCAVPSVTQYDYAGYVGGGSLRNNNLWVRGPGSAIGPYPTGGTFATDFGGFRGRLGRVFLAPSTDPSRGLPFSWNYRAEGPRVTDVYAARPLRKAILEMHEEAEGGH